MLIEVGAKQSKIIFEDGVHYSCIEGISTEAATPSDKTIDNIKKNIKRNYSRLHNLKEFRQIKSEPIAIIGGGPSLKDNLKELSKFKHKIACGSVHDYLVNNNVFCEYAVVCDPDPIMANYLRNPIQYTKYLISTGCDEKVYNSLSKCNIYMWHCFSEELFRDFKEVEETFSAVGGGCTVGLRSISIALMLGYSDLHFFGFDSCLGENNAHHSYNFTDSSEELGKLYKVKVGDTKEIKSEKEFVCAGYMVAQAEHFKDFYQKYNKYFNASFHGEGLISEFMKINKQENDITISGSKSRALESLLLQPRGTMI